MIARLMIRNGSDLKKARRRLGWSLTELAGALRLEGDIKKTATRLREIENGARPLTGPIAVAVEAFEAGFNPEN